MLRDLSIGFQKKPRKRFRRSSRRVPRAIPGSPDSAVTVRLSISHYFLSYLLLVVSLEPAIVGAISDHVFAGNSGLGQAVSANTVIGALICMAVLLVRMRGFVAPEDSKMPSVQSTLTTADTRCRATIDAVILMPHLAGLRR